MRPLPRYPDWAASFKEMPTILIVATLGSDLRLVNETLSLQSQGRVSYALPLFDFPPLSSALLMLKK